MTDKDRAPAQEATSPALDDVMMAMDVVDTLRHQDAVVARELGQAERDAALKQRLREIYASQGLEVSDRILNQGIAALKENRFVYERRGDGLPRLLAHAWIRRRTVGLVVVVVAVIAAVIV